MELRLRVFRVRVKLGGKGLSDSEGESEFCERDG